MSSLKRFASNPLVIMVSMFLGALVGIDYPEYGKMCVPIGEMFVSLIKMCLIPIVVSAVSSSVCHLLTQKNLGQSIFKITSYYILGLFIFASIAGSVAFFLEPAKNLLAGTHGKIQEISLNASFLDRTIDQSIEAQADKNLFQFITQSIPENIFKAFSDNNAFQILVFSIILGIATAFVGRDTQNVLVVFYDAVLSIFQKVVMSITIFLPFAVFALMATGALELGRETILDTFDFIWKTYVMYLVIFMICTLGMAIKYSMNPLQVVQAFKFSLVIAFATRSAIAAIPPCVETLTEKFRISSDLAKLLVPLGAVLARFGNTIYFAFLLVFISQLYGIPLTFDRFMVGMVACIFAGMNTSGATGAVTLGMLSLVTDPLGLPLGAILSLLVAIDPIIDPMRTLMIVYPNCFIVAMIGKNNPPLDKQIKKINKKLL
jgi:proton glutamate symport protein